VTQESDVLQDRIATHSPRRAADERRLFERYRRDGDRAARNAIVERFLPLAHYLARRYRGGGDHADDLVQVASLGLLNAIERFDPDRGIAFSSFAVPTIIGEIKRYFRDKGWAVRVPRELQERSLTVERLADDLERELGRTPTTDQIAARMDTTVEQVLEARMAASAHHGVSLDRPSGDDEDAHRTLVDTLGFTDEAFSHAEDAVTFDGRLARLSERERIVLDLRFREDLTQEEIGRRIGISQMHVSRLIRQAIEHLRATQAIPDPADSSAARPAATGGRVQHLADLALERVGRERLREV
jgi:RNA polymerase sigma-B factor